jgi:hypothetical protein
MRSKTVAFVLFLVALLATRGGAATSEAQCDATKRRLAGRKLAAKLNCEAKAKLQPPFSVDAGCLTRAEQRFAAAMPQSGTACPGSTSSIEGAVDNCVASRLVPDAPGTGRCPGSSLRVMAQVANAELACLARELVKPGSASACLARLDSRLAAGLAKAGGCASSDTESDIHACRDLLRDMTAPGSLSGFWLLDGSEAGGDCPSGTMPLFWESRLDIIDMSGNLSANADNWFGTGTPSGFQMELVGFPPSRGTCSYMFGDLRVTGFEQNGQGDITQTWRFGGGVSPPPPACPDHCMLLWTGTMTRQP